MEKQHKRLGIACLFLSLCLVSQAEASSDVTVSKALDGETLELSDGRIVRMIGVATNDVWPILLDRFKATEAQIQAMPLKRLSHDVLEYVEKNVKGRNIILSYDPANEITGNRDKNGTLLAYVWYSIHYEADQNDESRKRIGIISEDRLLNSELIKLGLVFVDTRTSFIHRDLFLRYERDAATEKIGFWRSGGELYQDILKRAQGSRAASVAGFVSKDAREMSLKSSWKAFTEVIQANPEDYHGYYERSWLGANPVHNQVTDGNLKDAEQAVALVLVNPKCYAQKHYLLRLLEKHGEAAEAYESAVHYAGKLGMETTVSDLTRFEVEAGNLKDPSNEPDRKGIGRDAFRAGLNEDHFLFFMARYKGFKEPVPEDVKNLFDKASRGERFQEFYQKYKDFLPRALPKDLIYKTQWAERGLEEPQEVLKWMESVGSYVARPDKDD